MSTPAVIPPHEIIIVPGNENNSLTAPECVDVRMEVFCREQKFPEETQIDQYDVGNTATHFLLRLVPTHEPVGTIRAVKLGPGSYKLTRLAVLKEYRAFKFGRSLVETLHDWIRKDAIADIERAGQKSTAESGVEVVAISQLPVKAFYGRFGYAPKGEEHDEDGKPHQKMVLQKLPLLL